MKIFAMLDIFTTIAYILRETEGYSEMEEQCFEQWGIPEEYRYGFDAAGDYYKCFNACFFQKRGMMQDGKMIASAFIDKVKDILEANLTQEERGVFSSELNTCIDKANNETDECEVAQTMIKCFY